MEQNLLLWIRLRVGSPRMCLANAVPNPPVMSSCKARDPQECVAYFHRRGSGPKITQNWPRGPAPRVQVTWVR